MTSVDTTSIVNSDKSQLQQDIQNLLISAGGLLRGHFRLASGRHSDVYVEKFRILERPWVLEKLCSVISSTFEDQKIDLVVGPTTGGIIVAYEVARQMNVPAVYVESEGGTRILKRGGVIPVGSNVLLVDDVLTTGVSLMDVLKVIGEAEATLVGVGVLIDRSEQSIDFGADLVSAYRFEAQSYAPDAIPDWLNQVPLTTPGTRQKELSSTTTA